MQPTGKNLLMTMLANFSTNREILFYLLSATLMMCIAGQVSADNKRAMAYYMAAEDAYAAGNYADSLGAVTQAEKLLGSSNPLTSSLKVKIYFESGRYPEAKTELDRFLEMDSADQLAREMSGYLIKIDKAVKDEEMRAVQARIDAARRSLEIDDEIREIKSVSLYVTEYCWKQYGTCNWEKGDPSSVGELINTSRRLGKPTRTWLIEGGRRIVESEYIEYTNYLRQLENLEKEQRSLIN